ncbi:MAG: OmpA family protein [Arenimonas sp.]|nr:OmpA family protein [Arenimonas sp.]
MIRLLLIVCLILFSSYTHADDPVVVETVKQLTVSMDALDQLAKPSDTAALERMQARQAITKISTVRSRDVPDAIDEANVMLKIADYAIKSEQLKVQLLQLDREHDSILLEASRRDAQLARKEAEQLRLKVLAFEEEQDLSLQETEPVLAQGNDSANPSNRIADARAKEAELQRLEEEISAQMLAKPDALLKSKTVNGVTRYTLSATAFEPGKSTLTASAKTTLMQLSKKLKSNGKTIHIEAYSDAVGDEAQNLLFTKKRADAVAAQFKLDGISSKKIISKGLGANNPLASNQSKTGRAQNRRVEIIQK